MQRVMKEARDITEGMRRELRRRMRAYSLDVAALSLLLGVSGRTCRRWLSGAGRICTPAHFRTLSRFCSGGFDIQAELLSTLRAEDADWMEQAGRLLEPLTLIQADSRMQEPLDKLLKHTLEKYGEALCG